MKNKLFNFNTSTKLSLVNTFTLMLLTGILYFLIPYILNYPKNTIDNDFQVQVVGIKYSMQFLILACVLTISIFLAFKFFYRNLSMNRVKENNEDTINKLRKRCFNYPYLFLLAQTIVPPIICAILLVLFNTNIELLIRICIVIFSISAIYSTISYMIGKHYFERILIQTSSMSSRKLIGIRLNMNKKLLIQTFPLFLYSSVIMILISISIMTTEKGDLLYHFYHEELFSTFSENNIYDIEDIKRTLTSFNLHSLEDEIIMFSADSGNVYYSKNPISDFLIQYTFNYYEVMNGQCFEYYGQNSQASLIKVHTNLGDYYVGIRFFVFNNGTFTPFFIVAIITILFNIFYIYFIGHSLSEDINAIVTAMEDITNLDNTLSADDLPITSNDEIGDLTLQFNAIQNLTKKHVQQIHANQDKMVEKECLASLGQMIGGIAHNLKTPIMSIAGAAEGLSDLVKEYNSSIDDPEVTSKDHHDIAHDMDTWIDKIKTHTSYMSDIITAVKGQAVTLSESESNSFTVEELLKRINILMKHELKNALIDLNIDVKIDYSVVLNGNVNSLVQVVNNLISNAIQSYNGKTNESIDLVVDKNGSSIVILVADHGCGMPQEVKDKLFKEMITTKGKNGTGLGLFMSYSTIRGHFNGNMTFESEINKGTTFKIVLPII